MSLVFGIDPGKRVAVAVYDLGVLVDACLLRPDSGTDMAGTLFIATWRDHRAVAYVEAPQVYRTSRSKGDPNDLIDIAVLGGYTAGLLHARLEQVRPHAWKGQVPKSVTDKRLRRELKAHELAALESAIDRYPASLAHNIIDAAAIGLWGVKKEGQRKV